MGGATQVLMEWGGKSKEMIMCNYCSMGCAGAP
jgi:hypothetical protein